MSLAASQFATIFIGSINVAMTFVSVMLIDRLGRRKLHLYGLGGMLMFSIILRVTLVQQVCIFTGQNSRGFSFKINLCGLSYTLLNVAL